MDNQVFVIAGLMILALLFLMAMFAKLFRKAGPHEAIIVYGFRGTRVVKGRGTVTKTRVLAGTTHSPRQQVIRVDREPEAPLDRTAIRDITFQARGYVRASDALLISDYGYGAATPEIFENIRARASLNGLPSFPPEVK